MMRSSWEQYDHVAQSNKEERLADRYATNVRSNLDPCELAFLSHCKGDRQTLGFGCFRTVPRRVD